MRLPLRPSFLTRPALLALTAAALVTLAPRQGHAEQFTLFDVTFNFTWEDAINASPSKSHYYVKTNMLSPQRPTNWVAPIDYRTGKVHIYLEVLEKPAGGQKQGWALCYVGGGSYGCPYTKYYTEKGVYESDVDMTSFYNNATIDWTKGITEVDLVYTINDTGQGHVHFFPELKDKTTPTKVRIAMVQVAKGSTYDAKTFPPGAGGTGAGGAGGTGGTGGGGAGGAAGASGSGGTGPSTGGAAGGGTAGSTTSAGTASGGTLNSAGSTGTAGAGGAASGNTGAGAAAGGGANGGAGSGGALAGSGSAGTPPAGAGTGTALAPTSGEDAGCAVAGKPSNSSRGAGWLAGLAAAAVGLRRRRPKRR